MMTTVMIKNIQDDIVQNSHHKEKNHPYLDLSHQILMKLNELIHQMIKHRFNQELEKKKKVVGAGRHRLHGDSLPPLAPSSASRRDDFTQNKGPPVGTPRPQPLVAQWAITSPAPQSTAEKLTTITSDNERDDDEEKYKSVKSTKRIVSPHPTTTNRITNDKEKSIKTNS